MFSKCTYLHVSEANRSKRKNERRGVSHKRCETENSFPLYKAETIFNKKFNSKVARKRVFFFFI